MTARLSFADSARERGVGQLRRALKPGSAAGKCRPVDGFKNLRCAHSLLDNSCCDCFSGWAEQGEQAKYSKTGLAVLPAYVTSGRVGESY
jgi:hypothetical protein